MNSILLILFPKLYKMAENTNSKQIFSNFWILNFYSTQEIQTSTIISEVLEIFLKKP